MRKKFKKLMGVCLAFCMVISSPVISEPQTSLQAAESGSYKVVDVTKTMELSDTLVSAPWWTSFSDYYRFFGDFAVTFDIAGSTSGIQNYNSPSILITTDKERAGEGYVEYALLRADNYGWGDFYGASTKGNCCTDWAKWVEIEKSYTATVYLQRKGTTVTVVETYTSREDGAKQYIQAYTVPHVVDDTIRAFFVTDGAEMTISKVTVETVDYSALAKAYTEPTCVFDLDYSYSEESLAAITVAKKQAEQAFSSKEQSVVDAAAETLRSAVDATISTGTLLSSGLVGCYDFKNNVTELISKENAVPVVVSNGTVNEDGASSLSYLDGGIQLGSYGLKLPTVFDALDNYTISVKVKFDASALGGFDKAIYCLQKPVVYSVNREVLYTGWGTSTPKLLSEIGSTATTWNWAGTSAVALVAGQTYGITVRKEANKTSMYIDGELVASATNAKTGTIEENIPVLLGANSWGLTKMAVYDCMIYNRTLSNAEVVALNGKTAEEVYVDYVNSTVGENNFYDISSYRGETFTAPTKEGKVFAGWFADAAFTTPIASDKKDGYAYAKFVDAKLLQVKNQVTAGTTAESESTNLRFMLGVDSLNFQKVGFDTVIGGSKRVLESNVVCSAINVTENGQTVSLTPATVFETESAAYMLSYKLTNAPNSAFNTEIQATPYWITLDGTKVSGTMKTFTISDAF